MIDDLSAFNHLTLGNLESEDIQAHDESTPTDHPAN